MKEEEKTEGLTEINELQQHDRDEYLVLHPPDHPYAVRWLEAFCCFPAIRSSIVSQLVRVRAREEGKRKRRGRVDPNRIESTLRLESFCSNQIQEREKDARDQLKLRPHRIKYLYIQIMPEIRPDRQEDRECDC